MRLSNIKYIWKIDHMGYLRDTNVTGTSPVTKRHKN